MALTDIHSHILPALDDGAKDLETAVSILEIYKKQGVTDIFATPHFMPMEISLEEFLELRKKSFDSLTDFIKDKDYPKIHLGAEVYYFTGLGRSEAVKELRMGETNYILIELPIDEITDYLISDLKNISEYLGLVPIIAHIERVSAQKGFKKLLKLIDDGCALAQINAASVLKKPYMKICKKLLKRGYVSFVASDTHSENFRAPKIKEALDVIKDNFDDKIYEALLKNMGEDFLQNKYEGR